MARRRLAYRIRHFNVLNQAKRWIYFPIRGVESGTKLNKGSDGVDRPVLDGATQGRSPYRSRYIRLLVDEPVSELKSTDGSTARHNMAYNVGTIVEAAELHAHAMSGLALVDFVLGAASQALAAFEQLDGVTCRKILMDGPQEFHRKCLQTRSHDEACVLSKREP